MWPTVTGSFFQAPQFFYVKKHCLLPEFWTWWRVASRWVLSRKKRNQPHQRQQLRGWQWGLLVWDKLIEHLVSVVHDHRSAFLTRSLFVRSLLVLCVAEQKVLSCCSQLDLCFVGRSSGQTHHGREKPTVIFPHMVLTLKPPSSKQSRFFLMTSYEWFHW